MNADEEAEIRAALSRDERRRQRWAAAHAVFLALGAAVVTAVYWGFMACREWVIWSR